MEASPRTNDCVHHPLPLRIRPPSCSNHIFPLSSLSANIPTDRTVWKEFDLRELSLEESEVSENFLRCFLVVGKLLAALKRLMSNLKKLKRLYLIDLMLDHREAQHLLDEVCDNCCLTLHTLVLVNTTRIPCPLLHVGVLLNLQVNYHNN